MISVRSGDERKKLGLGLEMEMEMDMEAELEEGEAPYCGGGGGNINNDGGDECEEDSTIDPDISLSYIGEKLQNILGHFQKDFEGGVSAENLGAKFGGYGSFLPTYQRSPSWTHTRSSPEARNYNSPRSPRKLHLEDQRQNSLASSSASPSARSLTASEKAVSVSNSLKGNGYLPPSKYTESSSKSGAVKKPVDPSDQRTLKVRIKVGSENLSTQKNAEIYSGLGLEVSPSSSLDVSPTASEGPCGKHLAVQEESPTSILQTMTSFPGDPLLSPLSEDLVKLKEKRSLRGKRETKLPNKTRLESSAMLANGTHSSRSSQKVIEQKKLKSSERDDAFSVELTNQKNKGNQSNTTYLLKKDDALSCEELVSNALKLPFLSSSPDSRKDMSTELKVPINTSKDGARGETVLTVVEKEHLDSDSAEDIGRVEKLGGMLDSSDEVSEYKKGNPGSSNAAHPQQDALKAEKSQDLDHSESSNSKGRKAYDAERTDPSRHFAVQKQGSVSEDGSKPTLEKSSAGEKRKQKVVHSAGAQGAYGPKDQLMRESSKNPKGGKSSHANGSRDLQKDHEKPGDKYKEFFGDIEFEEDNNESMSGEMTSLERLKDPQLVGKSSSSEYHNTSKEKVIGKNSEKPRLSDNYPRMAPHSEAPSGPVPLVQEDWVQCDECRNWRLLPLGTNPENLPDKWLCKMLTWLPEMNSCSIPEDDTTNTLRARQHIQLNNAVSTSAVMASNDARHPGQEHQNIDMQNGIVNGKKKHGSVKGANSTDLDGSTHSSNSRKVNLPTSGKSSNLNCGNDSPSVDASTYQHLRKSNGAAEKHNSDKKDKVSITNSLDKGTKSKIRNKRESDMEVSKASKRIKTEELQLEGGNWTSENGGISSKAGHDSTSLSNNASEDKYTNHKDLRGEVKKKVISDEGLMSSDKRDDKDSVRKRKAENHGSDIHRDRRKEKKARVSKSGGKDTSGSKISVETDRKSRSTKNPLNGEHLSIAEVADYLKSDMGPVQPPVAANSSSSKVSGSHKNKTSAQEVKGSPVESVSSSPLRYVNADKVTSARQNLFGKDDLHDPGSPNAVSPRRFSGGEDGGRNDGTGMVKKDAALTGNDHVTDAYDEILHQNNQRSSVKSSYEQGQFEERINAHHSQNGGSYSKKSGMALASHSKDKARASGSDLVKDNIKASDCSHDSLNHEHTFEEKSRSRSDKLDEKPGTSSKPDKFVSKKDTAIGTLNESSKGRSKKFGHDAQDVIKNQDRKPTLEQEHDSEKLAKRSDPAEGNGRKSNSLPPLARVQNDTPASHQPASGSQKDNSRKSSTVDASDNGDLPKASNQRKKAESHSGQPSSMRHPTPNTHKVRDVEAPSPVRRDSSSHAANSALKEAKDLKHLADRLKNSDSNESIGYYFQAALKFLHGATLLESGSHEATKHNELMHAMHIYSSTAKLCEFCAHEYEKSKDMAAAALAYKCVEVAYMRVVYSSHASASRDRHELQTALQIVPPGESPSSSASDVDNLNHQATTDKAALAKVVGSPQVSGSHTITARNRSGFLRILNLAQDVNFAMEASRKSRAAFTAATTRVGETPLKEGISSLKRALDYNFQDVEGLLRLVRVAMEAISR